MTTEEVTEAYFARAICGCIEVIHMANRRLPYDYEQDVIEIIRDGGTWEKRPSDEVKALPLVCAEHTK